MAKMYDKPSAYRSGMLVKLYREAGGRYSGEKNKQYTFKSVVFRMLGERQENNNLSS